VPPDRGDRPGRANPEAPGVDGHEPGRPARRLTTHGRTSRLPDGIMGLNSAKHAQTAQRFARNARPAAVDGSGSCEASVQITAGRKLSSRVRGCVAAGASARLLACQDKKTDWAVTFHCATCYGDFFRGKPLRLWAEAIRRFVNRRTSLRVMPAACT